MSSTDFWNNPSAANKVVGEVKSLKAILDPVVKVTGEIEDAATLWEMAVEAEDNASKQEVDSQLDRLSQELDRIEKLSLLGGKYDARNCYLSIYSREGGTEAQDWTQMLFRMYAKFCERAGWEVFEVDKTVGEEAGLKDITLYVKAPMAFGYLSAERGTHRLARVSPFNAQGKRQTSFAVVDVVPEFDDVDSDIELDPAKLEVAAFVRSSGPGGQNVNKVATAVRAIYHYDAANTLTVVCSVERSQEQNRSRALAILRGKVQLLIDQKREAERLNASGGKLEMGWGSQIRSYVIYDNRVKDHRTGHEQPNPLSVLDGDIQRFIDAELIRRAKEKAKDEGKAVQQA